MPQSSMPFERSIKRRKSTQFRFDISPESYSTFMMCIKNGMGIDPSAWAAGLPPTTVKNWLEKGEILAEEIDSLKPESTSWQYARFWTDYKKSWAYFEMGHSSNIADHSVSNKPGQWTASAWMLERRRAESYAQRHLINELADKKVMEVIKFLFDSSPTVLFREQLATMIATIPSLNLAEADDE